MQEPRQRSPVRWPALQSAVGSPDASGGAVFAERAFGSISERRSNELAFEGGGRRA